MKCFFVPGSGRREEQDMIKWSTIIREVRFLRVQTGRSRLKTRFEVRVYRRTDES